MFTEITCIIMYSCTVRMCVDIDTYYRQVMKCNGAQGLTSCMSLGM